MIKILVPFFLVLFLNNVSAEDLDGLDRDLKLLKSNLSLLSDKIALTDDELVTLGHIDELMKEVDVRINSLDGSRREYLNKLFYLEKMRLHLSKVESAILSSVDEKFKSEISLGGLKELEDILDNDEEFLFETVFCSDKYTLEQWRRVSLMDRRLEAIQCALDGVQESIENSERWIGYEGEVTVEFTLDSNGKVLAGKSTVDSPQNVKQLVLESIESIAFPVLGSSDTRVIYKMLFSGN